MFKISLLKADEELRCPMVFHFDGRYRSALECKFLEQVEEDLTQFWSICGDHSVLVFPSLSARYRFLIHQLVGRSSKLQTVSVGQGQGRRTVVYFAPERYRSGMNIIIIELYSQIRQSVDRVVNNYQWLKEY